MNKAQRTCLCFDIQNEWIIEKKASKQTNGKSSANGK